jgi:N-acetyl-gamma-glutamyl-phosphate reductase
MPFMKMIKVAIAGATGYTGGELIRILLHHPQVEIISLLTTSLVGQPVSAVHKDLYGDCDLHFTDTLGESDVLFLCLGHGLSREFFTTRNIPASCKIIDLGNDFRTDNTFGDKTFVYGIPELFKEEIQRTNYVANPGCFATSIILALAPLASSHLLTSDVHIHAITGSTGAGKQLGDTSHFSYRASNISIYKPFTHQHLAEINKTLRTLSEKDAPYASPLSPHASRFTPNLNMIPVRGDFTRGIFAAILTKLPDGTDEKAVRNLYETYYAASPFVHFAADTVSLKEVVNTNKALLNIHFHNGYIHITSVLDNLLKGASGQAVQNMNLLFGLAEDAGLRLKSVAF